MSASIHWEGITYHYYRVTYRVAGRRRQFTLLSPGPPWLREDVLRVLEARDVPNSTTVTVRAVETGHWTQRRNGRWHPHSPSTT